MPDKSDSRWSLLPIARWLPQYKAAWLRFDVVAGVTLAAYAVPVSLAYAALAGAPPEMGLYCYLVAGLGYAVFGSSRHLAVGPTSAISLVLGVTLAGMSAGDAVRQADLASLTALIAAGVFVAAWLLRLSVLVSFISESILTNFKCGAALVIASTQLPKLLGVVGGGDDFFERIGRLVQQAPGSNVAHTGRRRDGDPGAAAGGEVPAPPAGGAGGRGAGDRGGLAGPGRSVRREDRGTVAGRPASPAASRRDYCHFEAR